MLRRWLTVLLAVLTALVAASPASASTHLGPQTRVGAFELAAHTLVGPARSPSPRNHRAKSRITYNCASDPLLGVYDMRARWWSPRLGGFLSADNFGYADASSTLWGWPRQNPARWNDPTGRAGALAAFPILWGSTAAESAGASVGAAAGWGAAAAPLLPVAITAGVALAGKFAIDAYFEADVRDQQQAFADLATSLNNPTVYAQEEAAPVPDYPVPDGTGRIHGDLPQLIPDAWTGDEVEDAIQQVIDSIAERNAQQRLFGEEGNHRDRIREEEEYLRRLRRRQNDLG